MSSRAASVGDRAARIGRDVAAPLAEAVAREGRFPREAIAALREARLLGAMVDRELGGESAPFGQVADACYVLGRYCANTAMVFAMHQIQVACLLDYGRAKAWMHRFMRDVAGQQMVLASATTEGATGGDTSRSDCAVEGDDSRIRIVKAGCRISYAEEADAILVTARRGPDSPPTDQVLCVVPRAQVVLVPLGAWDAFGMRGTCSATWQMEFSGLQDQVLPAQYADILERTMLPVCHTLWSSLWLGIASDALARASACLRAQARQQPQAMPLGARRLAEALATLQAARAHVAGAVGLVERARDAAAEAPGLAFRLAMNGVKTATSATALHLVQEAMLVCDIAGYRNDSPFSIGRHLRDIASAPIMVNNDRILGATAALAVLHRVDEGLLA